MKSIVRIIVQIFVITNLSYSSPQCGLYGMPACSFLPAPPGSTPSCAEPGKTYCEHAPYYPTNVIKHLIHKWEYDFSSLLADETGEEFNAVGYRNPVTISQFYGPPQTYTSSPPQQHYSPTDGYKYDPPSQKLNHNNHNFGNIYNEEYTEPIYIPTPSNYNNHQNSGGISTNYQTHKSQENEYQKKLLQDYNYYYSPRVTYYNRADNFKRYLRDIKAQNVSETPLMMKRKKRSIIEDQTNNQNIFAQNFLDKISNDDVKSRQKRQSAGRTALCQTRSSFIQPQAALSSKGNWMYVVNQVETARQLVKTETCSSSVCSNLCQLPNGYNSRCEQKFVQKRLVALEGSGQRLYTDTFWFPSCCVCTIST